MTQRIKIKAPPPPRGINKAKIIISNGFTENSYDYEYSYLCGSPVIGNPGAIEGISDDDITNAYEACLDNIADLFCEDIVASPTENLPILNEFKIIPSLVKYKTGTSVRLRWKLRGIGKYSLFYTDSQTKNSNIETSDFEAVLTTAQAQRIRNLGRDPENFTKTFAKMLVLPSKSDKVVFTLVIYKTSGGVATTAQIQIDVEEQPAGTTGTGPPVSGGGGEALTPVNGIGDIKRETYYWSDFALLNKTPTQYINSWLNNPGEFVTKDFFREKCGSFWIKNTRLEFMKEKNAKPNGIQQNKFFITSNFENIDLNSVSEPYILDRIKTTTNTDILNYLPTNSVFDLNYVHQRMYTKKESAEVELPFNSRILDVRTEYNFYNKKYEEIQSSGNIQESILPNMYFLHLNDQAIETGETPELGDDVTLDPDIQKLLRLDKNVPDNIEPLQVDSYYDYYVDIFKNNNINGDVLNRSKNIIIPYSFLDSIEEYGNKNQMFPMFVDIRFDTYPFEIVGSLLKNTAFGQQFVTNCISSFQNGTNINTFSLVKEEESSSGSRVTLNNNRYLDITNLLSLTGSIGDNFIFLGNYNDFNATIGNPLVQTIQSSIFKAKLTKILKKYSRSYRDILDGFRSYKETIFYKIAKYSLGDLETPIQEIYIPNDPSKDYLRYVDTQVLYDKKYYYKIYSYDFIIGNEYSSITDINNVANEKTLKNDIKLYMIENLYDEFQAKVNDKPPLRPEVSLIPFKDVDNKMLILLNGNTIETEEEEVIIKEEDRVAFKRTREAQNLREQDLISFGGDDTIKKYQIFFTTKPPQNYQDFKNAEMVEISTMIDTARPDIRITATSYIASLVPNKKYYYTFRCIDIHDHLSNPTLVYEIEIINESGTIYPMIKEWKFPKIKGERDATKEFRRFIMVKPQILQEILRVDTSGVQTKEKLLEKIEHLGTQQVSIWEKKYKMRIVSKNTGKIYDINFGFDLDKQINE